MRKRKLSDSDQLHVEKIKSEACDKNDDKTDEEQCEVVVVRLSGVVWLCVGILIGTVAGGPWLPVSGGVSPRGLSGQPRRNICPASAAPGSASDRAPCSGASRSSAW